MGQLQHGHDDGVTCYIITRLCSSFPALVTRGKAPATVETLSRAELPAASTVKSQPGECDLLVSVEYSTLNYKDALVATGK